MCETTTELRGLLDYEEFQFRFISVGIEQQDGIMPSLKMHYLVFLSYTN